jgi:uncharacterized membrane protein YagU involved in acid resistance
MMKRLQAIVKTGLIAGSLDLLAALVYYSILTGDSPLNILKYIASGIFGPVAFSGGTMMMLAGLALHFFIAFAFTLFFFWLFPRFEILARNRILTGIVYGIFVWMIMNIFIVPLSNVPQCPFIPVHAIINGVILIVCIGIPISFMADRYYKNWSKANGPVVNHK